jgi:hypothetical protein
VDTSKESFDHIITCFMFTAKKLLQKDWSTNDYTTAVWGTTITLRMLRSHLFTAHYLQIPVEQTGLTVERTREIYGVLQKLLEIEGEESSETVIRREACLTLIHAFDVFYSSHIDKLNYLASVLTDIKDGRVISPVQSNI